MSNLTISIDESTVRHARIRAIQEGTSVSAKVREFLAQYARGESPTSLPAEAVQSVVAGSYFRTFRGTGGMRPGIDPTSNRAIEAAMETDEELIAKYNPPRASTKRAA